MHHVEGVYASNIGMGNEVIVIEAKRSTVLGVCSFRAFV